MALIKCPECGREISDKVKACPHCGFPFYQEDTGVNQVEVTDVKINKKKVKKIIFGVLSIILIILVAIITVSIINTNREKKEQEKSKIEFNTYVDNLNEVENSSLSSAAKAETLCNLTSNVWHDCIFKKVEYNTKDYVIESIYKDKTSYDDYMYNDFNDGLSALFSDSSTETEVSNIKSDKSKIDNLMKELQNPPDDLKSCYQTVCDLYSIYSKFTDLAINPTGSLTTFNSNMSSEDSDFMTQYNKLKTQIPQKKE